MAQREQREAERRLVLTGRTLRLPGEEPAREARARALVDALDVLHDLHQRILAEA